MSTGYPGDDGAERIREREEGTRRFPPAELFFAGEFGRPLGPGTDGYGEALEAVRMGPSATNKQPWRIVRRGDDWHFYLLRTRGYGKGSPFFKLLRIADLQRVDLGIAMCHFELVARECGRDGRWVVEDPGLTLPGPGIEYTATWRAAVTTPSGLTRRRRAVAVTYDGGVPAAARRSSHVRDLTQSRARPEHQPHVPGLRPRQPVRPPRPLLRAGGGRVSPSPTEVTGRPVPDRPPAASSWASSACARSTRATPAACTAG